MRSTEVTQQTSASPAAVWARWVEVERWPEQNDGMEWARLDGPLAVGTRIVMKPRGSRKASCRITEITPLQAFRTQTALPLARLRIDHEMSAGPDGTEFRHRLSMTGPLAWLFWRLFGRQLAASLPAILASIARLSELDHAR
jgi:hypothetical protein